MSNEKNSSLMLGRDEEVGRRVRVRLAGLEDDLGAGHGGGGVGVGLEVGERKIYTAKRGTEVMFGLS